MENAMFRVERALRRIVRRYCVHMAVRRGILQYAAKLRRPRSPRLRKHGSRESNDTQQSFFSQDSAPWRVDIHPKPIEHP